MKQVTTISVEELIEMSKTMYDGLVKAVVDLAKEQVVVDAEMHVDEEQLLLESGSLQANLWGINLYPAKYGSPEFIEFDSMINIRPRQHNTSRAVEDSNTRAQIVQLITGVVHE